MSEPPLETGSTPTGSGGDANALQEARVLAAGELRAGLQAEFEREIGVADIEAFATVSGDRNPLHMDERYAARTNYGRRIVHGAFQAGLASTMAGMYLPGREVVVGSFLCRFPTPLYCPARVRVHGEITAWVPASASGTLRVRIVDLSTSTLTSEIHVGFSLHEGRPGASRPARSEYSDEAPAETSDLAPIPGDKPLVLITGASGGIGRHLAAVLREVYGIVGVARATPVESERQDGMAWIAADLMADDWERTVAARLAGRRLHAIVHSAWPSGPQGGLLDVEASAVSVQIEFGSATTIRLARFLREHAADSARMVALGTTAATLMPVVAMSAYSLGKAVLEHTVRLLAPELARSGIAINVVAPSFVPVGMNNAKTNRVVLMETAKVPLGRLCSPEDIARAVEYFLSPGAAFVTGQILPLTGGRL